MNPAFVQNWYEQYKDGIYRYILSITHDPQLAEDVLQDTFVKLLAKGIQFEPGKERAWLYKVARNLCYDCLKRADRLHRVPSPCIPQPEQNWKFIELISPLSQKEQEIIALKFIGGFTHKQIAQIMGITVAAAKKRYERAMQKLRQEMEVSV